MVRNRSPDQALRILGRQRPPTEVSVRSVSRGPRDSDEPESPGGPVRLRELESQSMRSLCQHKLGWHLPQGAGTLVVRPWHTPGQDTTSIPKIIMLTTS